MNTGRTTSFFGCFLVGILMSKKIYDKIDVFLLSFLVVSDEKARESILVGFNTAVRLKKNTFFTFLFVLIFCIKIMNYFLCNLNNFMHFVLILCWASNSYIKIENMYSIKMDILLLSILLILIFWV